MYRLEDIEAMEDGAYKEALRWELSRRWRCCVCSEDTLYLEEPWAGLGCFCCGACGMTGLRPYRLELTAVPSGSDQDPVSA